MGVRNFQQIVPLLPREAVSPRSLPNRTSRSTPPQDWLRTHWQGFFHLMKNWETLFGKKRRRGRKQLLALSLSQKIVWGPVNPICCQGLPKQWRNRVDPGRALMLPMGIAQNRFSVNGSIARGIIQPALLMKWVGTSDHFSHLGISSSCYERICLKNKPPAMVICKAMYHLSLNSFSFLSFQGTN